MPSFCQVWLDTAVIFLTWIRSVDRLGFWPWRQDGGLVVGHRDRPGVLAPRICMALLS